MQYQETDIKEITSGPFLLREEPHCPEGLKESVREHGLFYPLLVRREAGRHVLVHGHRRIAALRAAGKDAAIACVLDESIPLDAVIERLAAEHGESGNLSPVGIGRLLALAAPPGRNEQEKILALLGENPRHHKPEFFMKLLELPQEARSAIDRGAVAAATALAIARLEPAARAPVCAVIAELALSRSAQREFVDTVRELAKRRKETEADTAAALMALARGTKGTPRQRGAVFIKKLAQLRSPRLSAAEQEFARFTAALGLPENVSLSPALAFESDRVSAKIEFADRGEFEKFWERAKDLLPTRR